MPVADQKTEAPKKFTPYEPAAGEEYMLSLIHISEPTRPY